MGVAETAKNIRLMTKQLKITQNDPYLVPFEPAIVGRHEYAIAREKELLGDSNGSLSDFASGYLYFGLFKVKRSWVLREWAPNATAIYLIGDFNQWQKSEKYRLQSQGNFPAGPNGQRPVEWS